MTCIVAWVEDGKVYMGGDSAASGDWAKSLRIQRNPKVFKKGEFIIGYTSSFRMGQLLQFSLSIPKHKEGQTDLEYMASDFVTAVVQCFKDNGYASVNDNRASGGTFLVGYRGAIYQIQDDFAVLGIDHPFDSCGCGENYAMGALLARMDDKIKPEERINAALTVAEQLSSGVRRPFHIVST